MLIATVSMSHGLSYDSEHPPPYNTCASYDLYDFGCNPASLFRNIPLFPLSNCFDYGCKGNILYRYRHTG